MEGFLEESLTEECFRFILAVEERRALRYTYFFSLLLVEVDDSRGRPTTPGLSRLIRRSVRDTDMVGTLWDHQCSVILHHAEPSDLATVGERIRSGFETYRLIPEGPDDEARTVSVGGACFPTHAPDTSGLLRIADEMLKRAHSEGGNRVCIA